MLKKQNSNLSDEQYAHAASVAWQAMSDDEGSDCRSNGNMIHVKQKKHAFLLTCNDEHIGKPQGFLPIPLKGGVSYKMLTKDGAIVSKSDYVNIEYAVRNNNKIFIAVVNGGGKGRWLIHRSARSVQHEIVKLMSCTLMMLAHHLKWKPT